MERRPNPEILLKQVQAEEQQAKTGKLKIYLGAAPGVGKTYTMLKDALAKRAQGLDVLIGIAESHGRTEIEDFLKQLNVMPRQTVHYRGNQLFDFDLDAALARNPGLILIDEMAHTNAPGLRHAKRWQDIKELLDRGIDVYTTLNVQHIESVSDVVSQIISAPVKETVPDSMLEIAETIELIDLPTEELLKRLEEGKVYIPEQSEWAKTHFFKKGNLTALRELALRITAERVGSQVLLYRQGQGIQHIWAIQEKILVCVGPQPEALKLIRTSKRMATNLHARWIAAYVNTPELQANEQQRNNAIQNLRLAEQLGAETRVLSGVDITDEILYFAREQNITQIIIWKEIRARWKEILFFSLADKMVRYSGDINIYVITGNRNNIQRSPLPSKIVHKPAWKIYVIAAFLLCTATLINFIFYDYFNTYNLIMVYLLAVSGVALFGKAGPALMSAILSVILFEFLFVPNFFSNFSMRNGPQLLTLVTIGIVTYTISHLSLLAQRQAESARFYERQTSALYTLNRQLASTRGIDKLIETGTQYIADLFQCDVLVVWAEHGQLRVRGKLNTEITLDEKEQGIIQWVYDLGQVAGLGTHTLPLSDALYLPLSGAQSILGVLRVHPKTTELLSSEQMQLLTACIHQLGLALEVDQRQADNQEKAQQQESDKLQTALLQAVSHDLRTPVASVLGIAGTLIEMTEKIDKKKVKKYAESIYFEAEQLNRLINNLFQIAYLETEQISLQKKPNSMPELVFSVLKSLDKKVSKRQIKTQIPHNFPLISFDKSLIEATIFNLIDNAMKFTKPNTEIDIILEFNATHATFSVADQGPGIMIDEVEKLFEKFYRGRLLSTERGLGLGLAICRHVISAHGGKIWTENRPEGGAIFVFALPLDIEKGD
jgi:two-component system sensor histidine kinase KdpD